MAGIGVWDVHCEYCGAFRFVDSPAFVFCLRCGNQMTILAPLQETADQLEKMWLSSPAGKAWLLTPDGIEFTKQSKKKKK